MLRTKNNPTEMSMGVKHKPTEIPNHPTGTYKTPTGESWMTGR